MPVLILKNIATEGPGTIQTYLDSAGMTYRVVDLQSEPFPDAAGFDTLVMLGGPMSVNDAAELPYLAKEIALAEDFMRKGRPVFGVCLGAQIMAKALGGNVYCGPGKEIGWLEIELMETGLKDPVMRRLATHPRAGDLTSRFMVFHWHGETFDIPEGAERLAKSALYENQAFRYLNSYAFQFHIEVQKETVVDWLKDEPVDLQLVRCETESFYDNCFSRAMNFYEAFFHKGSGDEPTGADRASLTHHNRR